MQCSGEVPALRRRAKGLGNYMKNFSYVDNVFSAEMP